MTVYKLLLLPGDGIGPEVMAEVERVIDWVNAREARASRPRPTSSAAAAYDAHGEAISDATMARAHAADAVMFGAVGGPKWDDVPYERARRPGCCACARISSCSPISARRSATRRSPTPLAQARPGRRPRHHDRARADRRRLFRRAEGDHRSRQRPEARRRHAGLRHLRDRAHRRASPSSLRAAPQPGAPRRRSAT